GDDGSAIPIGSGNERALLALLLLDANRPMSVDRLMEGLWGERPPPSGLKTVQVYVSRLRRRLPADRVATTAGGYQLRLEPGALDAYQLARDLLVRELGIEPGKSLRDLQQQVLQHAPSLDLPAAPAAVETRTGFVGRGREMAKLFDALEDARRGIGCLFLLVG